MTGTDPTSAPYIPCNNLVHRQELAAERRSLGALDRTQGPLVRDCLAQPAGYGRLAILVLSAAFPEREDHVLQCWWNRPHREVHAAAPGKGAAVLFPFP